METQRYYVLPRISVLVCTCTLCSFCPIRSPVIYLHVPVPEQYQNQQHILRPDWPSNTIHCLKPAHSGSLLNQSYIAPILEQVRRHQNAQIAQGMLQTKVRDELCETFILHWRDGGRGSLGRPGATRTGREFLHLALFFQQDKYSLILLSADPGNTHSAGCNPITLVGLHYALSSTSVP